MLEKSMTGIREQFNFPETVLMFFRFLIEDFGFAVIKQDSTLVRFESGDVFVNIYHGRASYEVGIEIGELRSNTGLPEFGYTLGEIISASDPEAGAAYRADHITEPELIEKYVSKISELVKNFAPLALVGNKDFFKRVSDLQARKSNKYLKNLELNRVRSEVEIAWRNKNYKQVVELFEPVAGDLTTSEIKKFDYAKRKLADTKR
jgi:hypothetical protein